MDLKKNVQIFHFNELVTSCNQYYGGRIWCK